MAKKQKLAPYVPDGQFVKSETYQDQETIETDLLIVGSGIAGLWAAISAAEKGVKRIAIVDKGSIARSSTAYNIFAGTVYFEKDLGDSKELWLREMAREVDFLCRQDMWDDLLETSQEKLEKLQSWGLTYNFHMPFVGERTTSDANRHIRMRFDAQWKEKGLQAGKALVSVLLNQVIGHKHIRYFSKTMIVNLLTADGKINGAVGLHRVTGKSVAFNSKAVILAAGQCSFRGQFPVVEIQTGDGFALAYNAGSRLSNMEFLTNDIASPYFGFEGGSLMGDMGCRFINGLREPFMKKYHPKGSSAPINHTARGMATEYDMGRGPIALDTTRFLFKYLLRKAAWEKMLPQGMWQKVSWHRLKEIGHDVTRQPEPWLPVSFGILGAVRTDLDCRTDIEGLYAAGVTQCVDPGLIKGTESARAMWSGEKSGRVAGDYIKRFNKNTFDSRLAGETIERAVAPMARSGGPTADEVLKKIQEAIFPYNVSVLKSEQTLLNALDRIRKIGTPDLLEITATDPHELIKAHETLNMLTCAHLFLEASLQRTESRGDHFRTDYPETSNDQWLKWINLSRADSGSLKMEFEEVPIERYPVRPENG